MLSDNKEYIGNPLGFFNDNLEKMQAGGSTKGSWGKSTNSKKRKKHTKKTCSKNTKKRFKHCM